VVAGDPEHGRDLRDVQLLPQLQLDKVLLAGAQAAERSSARSSARSAPPVTSTDSSLISGATSSAEVAALASSRSRRWHSLRATA
jgi:hypothetical protein